MGIFGLRQFIEENAPEAINIRDLSYYRGCRIAVDAPVVIYQCITSPLTSNKWKRNDGKQSGHIFGLLLRTSYMIENDIWPVYVFDGKKTSLKDKAAQKRQEERARRMSRLKDARNRGDTDVIEKLERQLNEPTDEIILECKALLMRMGIPYLDAPGEAEAYCAALCRAGIVCGAATTDMDALAFGTTIMLPDIMNPRQKYVTEINHDSILDSLDLTREQLIDLCILLGCDFCDKIRGTGRKSCLGTIRRFGSIEEIIDFGSLSLPIPDNWKYEEARELFKNDTAVGFLRNQLRWTRPDEGLLFYLFHDLTVAEKKHYRVSDYVSKLMNSKVPPIATGNGYSAGKGVNLSVFSQKRWACVNTGTEYTVITKKFWKAIKPDYEKSGSPSYPVNNLVVTWLGHGAEYRAFRLIQLEITIAGLTYKNVNAYVLDMDSFCGKEDIILGRDFVSKHVPEFATGTGRITLNNSPRCPNHMHLTIYPLVECPYYDSDTVCLRTMFVKHLD